MGVCISSPDNFQQKVNKEIDQQIMKDKLDMMTKIKLLLLGPGECGKSTILKQMRILHLNGFSKVDLLDYMPLIHSNIITSITTLVDARKILEIKFQNQELEAQCSIFYRFAEQENITFNWETIEIIRNLWNDQGIQECYEKRAQIQLNDSAKHFLDDLDRITTNDYVPTEQDVLHTRVATIGIVEIFSHTNNWNFSKLFMKYHQDQQQHYVFSVFDVGGQKSERRKWLSCFDNVNAVIFIAALSDFDIVMREDEVKNRMTDTLELFDQIFNSEFLFSSDMILFLNKQDLFIEKLKHSSITIAFPDYTGPCSYDESLKYIKEKFLSLNRNKEKIVTHVTSATDTNQVKVIYRYCYFCYYSTKYEQSKLSVKVV